MGGNYTHVRVSKETLKIIKKKAKQEKRSITNYLEVLFESKDISNSAD